MFTSAVFPVVDLATFAVPEVTEPLSRMKVTLLPSTLIVMLYSVILGSYRYVCDIKAPDKAA